MLILVGALLVIGGVLGGYTWEGGAIHLLNQPAEFLVIGGAAMGVIKALIAQVKRLFTPPPGRKDYTDLLVMQYQLFRVVQSTGVMALETHFDNPKESPILSKYPTFL